MKIKRKLAIILLIFFINLSPISLSSLFNNSQAVVSQDINFDQEWTTDQVIDKVVTIRAGVTLTVRSGVTLTFDSGSINVLGKMVISGTSENPVKMRRSENSASYSVAVSPGGNLVMRNVDMSGAGAGVFQVQNKTYLNTAYAAYQGGIHMKGGSLDAQGCNFHDNDVAIYVNNNSTGKVVVNRSKFSNNKLLDVAFEDRLQSDIINFKYNWWGNASGPQETCEVYGTEKYCYYDKIGGSVDFSDWLREENFHDPVIIVPGIMGSWKLTNGGELKLDPIFGTYDDLVEIFEKNGYEKGKDLFEFPYQWRDSNVNNAKLLHDKIAEIKQEKNWPKVDLVAHSMGGLMAREYIESSYYKNDIDQLVTMGTPHAGSPEDYLIWDGGSMPPSSSAIIGYISKLVFKQEAEEAGYDNIFDYLHKMPIKSVQELLPTYDYLYDVESNKLRSYLNGESYPKNIFLDNLNLPSNKNKLGNVEVTNITGKLKSNKTINKIRVERPSSSEDDIWAHGKPENYDSLFGDHGLEYGSGDGTVPAESAEKISSDRKIELAAAHSELPSEGAATAYSILAGKNPQVSVNKTLIGNMLAIFGFSPIDIQVISPSGLKYGKDFENDKSFKNINGSYYTGFDTENEFITIPNPEEGKYRIVTQGTEEGGDYRIEVSNVSRNDDAGQVTASTVAISGIATPEKIEESKVEVSGDLVVKENLDILAPSTSNSLEGILGTNDWHTSDVTLLLPATDDENGSGVAETKYSLDNASTWVTYIDPIALTQEGIFNVQYFSIDKAGNKEETKTAIIKIDKTAPEAKLIFNVATQKLEVIGRDNLSENVVATISEQVNIENDHANDRRNVFWFWGWLKKENKKKIIGTATLVDQAGHKTEVVWEKKSSKDHRIDLAISSIAYDGIKEDVTNSSLQYKWMQDWWKRKYLLFASHLSTEEVSLESHYFPSKNQTWLMEKPKEIADDDGNDNAEKRPVWKKMTGMIIPSIITDKGSIKINY